MPNDQNLQPTQTNAPYTQEEINYFMQFAQSYMDTSNMMGGFPFVYNPLMQNIFLKNINMNPVFKDRDSVEKMVQNPKDNEQALRRISQHLYNVQTPYKRLVHYFADMLTFDWYPIPMGVSKKEMAKDEFKKDLETVHKFFDKFNAKKEFSKILLGMLLEDGKFTYLREDLDGFTLQEMPSDYCVIDAWSWMGYLYSFNLLYFQQVGVDMRGFAPEFRKYYRDAMDMQSNKNYYPNIKPELRDGQWFYWQELSPENAWVFKFHNNMAGLVPPFVGLFVDAIELDSYKQLQKSKEILDSYKIIFGTIPRHKDGTNKSGNSKDDFALDPITAASYSKNIKASLPEQVDFKAAPFENLQSFDFQNTNNKDSVVGNAMRNFYRSAGADQSMFNADKPNASTMKASTRIDSAFIERLYEQFETFCTYHVNRLTKKYKFKIKFEGTIFDQEDRKTVALELAQNGIITPRLASANNMTLRDMQNSIDLMSTLGFTKLVPLQSAHTMSSKDAGRPTSKGSSESKDTTIDAGSNENKAIDNE